jgi:hypothetical protein
MVAAVGDTGTVTSVVMTEAMLAGTLVGMGTPAAVSTARLVSMATVSTVEAEVVSMAVVEVASMVEVDSTAVADTGN